MRSRSPGENQNNPISPLIYADAADSKNMVGGRYLATFSSNSIGISRNQVAELVAAAVLVATFRATPRNCFNHEGHEGEEKQAIGPWLLAFG